MWACTLPASLRDNCKTVSGEDALGEAIATAGGGPMRHGPRGRPQQLRSARSAVSTSAREFMDNIVARGLRGEASSVRDRHALSTVTQRLKDHTGQAPRRSRAPSATPAGPRRSAAAGCSRRAASCCCPRCATIRARRQHRGLHARLRDFEKCTACGECALPVPPRTRATCRLRPPPEPAYCVGCGLCAGGL